MKNFITEILVISVIKKGLSRDDTLIFTTEFGGKRKNENNGNAVFPI